jgi:uncharacterized protein
LLNDTFIFDGVVHVLDWSMEKLSDRSPEERATREEEIRLGEILTGDVFDLTSMVTKELPEAMAGSPEANYDLIFGESPTDMAMVGSLPVEPVDEHEAPSESIRLNHAFASAYPERCLFAGGVQPFGQSLDACLSSIRYQVNELGAQSMKFYPFHWYCDDREIAYPLYEECGHLGIDVLQFHLCLPAEPTHNVEMQRPNSLQNAARDFPDLKFVMHHPMPLYFEETVNIVQRFPNIHLIISPLIQMSLIKPRLVQKLLGQLLQQIGSEKLIYGSEGAMGGNPTKYIEALMQFRMPDDLQTGYGFPEMTDQDRRNIFGLNLARLMNVDIDQRLAEIGRVESGGSEEGAW